MSARLFLAALVVASSQCACEPECPIRTSPAGVCVAFGPCGAGPCEEGAYVGPFRARGDHFEVWEDGRYRPVFLRAVTVGGARPGEFAYQITLTVDDWTRWLTSMSEGGLNAILVFDLHPPALYEALRAWNLAHPSAPLYLVQGIYMQDTPSGDGGDLWPEAETIDPHIERTIDCVHAMCPGYASDASPWIIGYLVGREVYAYEVRATDAAHPDATRMVGGAISFEGSPTATWVATRVDHAIVYERLHYGVERPAAFASWVELDPLHHPTEPPDSGQDVAEIDLSRMDLAHAPAGAFISYNAYPYYPHFLNDDPEYLEEHDALGVDAFRAYLRALHEHHAGLPLLLAEYGVPSSWGRAAESASLMHQGHLDERAQGIFAARMLRDMHDLGLAGGSWFQWEDGWWKSTWINRRRAFPLERGVLWHDLLCPEEHFGLLAFDPDPPTMAPLSWGDGASAAVESIEAGTNAEAVTLALHLPRAMEPGDRVEIGFDVLDPSRGEPTLPSGAASERGLEAALVIERAADGAYDAQFLVSRCVDLSDLAQAMPGDYARFRSRAGGCGGWTLSRWLMRTEELRGDGSTSPERTFEVGALRVRVAGEMESSLDAVVVDGASMTVRLPWNLFQLTDPSSRSVLDPDPSGTELTVTVTDEIAVVVADGTYARPLTPIRWETWDEAPHTTERLKESARILFEYTRGLPRFLD